MYILGENLAGWNHPHLPLAKAIEILAWNSWNPKVQETGCTSTSEKKDGEKWGVGREHHELSSSLVSACDSPHWGCCPCKLEILYEVMCKPHPNTQEAAHPVCALSHVHTQNHILTPRPLSPADCPSSFPGGLVFLLTLENTKPGGETWHAGALEFMDHAGFYHLGPARGPGSPGAVSQGSRNPFGWSMSLQKKGEKQDVTLEELLLQKQKGFLLRWVTWPHM